MTTTRTRSYPAQHTNGEEIRMATTEEIERRVEEADASRSAQRTAAAKRVGELAQRRAEAAEKLAEIERELGDVLAESSDVISFDELARFTDVPAVELNRWLNGRKIARPKRTRTATTSAAKSEAGRASPTARTSPAGARQAPGPPDSTRTPEPVT
jgi:predicted ATP-dependent protease